MKSKYYVTLKDGLIHNMTDTSHPVEMGKDDVPVTQAELALLRICNGDLAAAEEMIENIKGKIARVELAQVLQ